MNHRGTETRRVRTAETRSPLERMVFLAASLRIGRQINTRLVAARFEVNRKTISRDLEFMQDRLGYEIEWVPGEWSYRLRRAPLAVL